MSNYRVKHFQDYSVLAIEKEVNSFIKENAIEVLRYRLISEYIPSQDEFSYIGVLEYEELDHET